MVDLIAEKIMDAMCRMDSPAIATKGWLVRLINGPGTIEHQPTMDAVERLVRGGQIMPVHDGWMLRHPLRQLKGET